MDPVDSPIDPDDSLLDDLLGEAVVAANLARREAPARDLEDRYRLIEVFAEGGMGTVYKARDLALDRQVAIKMPDAARALPPELCRRFVQEAQIGGRLQHPGIVPVYELGVGDDGRPFFAMKLVEGETLAGLLAARDDVTADRGRWLALFEKIAQTIAYAHEAGVLHLDVKPSNVMVGAFGEVFLMDWGLAELEDDERARPAEGPTSPGPGTPAYIAPEVARGDRPDRRADVFSLGAILFEILTGSQPWTGDTRSQLGRAAATGELDDALARLAACGADEALLELTRDCIAADPAARPADGGAVAERVGRYLAGIEAAKRAADTAAAVAETRLRHERRARRLAVALTVTVAAAITVGVIGYAEYQSRAERRIQANARAVTAQVDRAQGIVSAALRSPEIDEAQLREAAAIVRAAAANALPEIDAELRERTATVEADIVREIELLEQRRAQAAADARIIAGFEEIRSRMYDEQRELQARAYDWHADHAAFRRLFRDYGIDVLELEPTDAAARITESGIREWLTWGVGDWAKVVRRLLPDGHADRTRIQTLARAVQPTLELLYADPLDVAALLEFAKADDHEDPVGPLVLGVAVKLEKLGHGEEALALLRRVQFEAPEAFSAHVLLATQLSHSEHAADREVVRERIGCLTAALALRPDSPAIWISLGRAWGQLGERERAVRCARRAVELRPDTAWVHHDLAGVFADLGRDDEAIAEYRHAAELSPGLWQASLNLSAKLHGRGEFAEAKRWVCRAIRANPTREKLWGQLGVLESSLERHGAAVVAFEGALRVLPPDALEGRAYYNYFIGYSHITMRNWRAAVEALQRATELHPVVAVPFVVLSRAYEGLHDPIRAFAAHHKALEVKGDKVDAKMLASAGHLALLARLPEEAVRLLRASLEREPSDIQTRVELAQALTNLGEFDEVPGLFAGYQAGTNEEVDIVLALSEESVAWRDRLDEALQEGLPDSDLVYSAVTRLAIASGRPWVAAKLLRRRMGTKTLNAYWRVLAITNSVAAAQNVECQTTDEASDWLAFACDLLERELERAGALDAPDSSFRDLHVLERDWPEPGTLAEVPECRDQVARWQALRERLRALLASH